MISYKARSVLAVAALAVGGLAFCGASLAQQDQKLMTNQNVVNMLRASLPEQRILTTMRTRPAKFDVSNQARAAFDRQCAAIKPVGVSTGTWAAEVRSIWDAMTNVVVCQQTNGRGGEGACVIGGQQGSKAGSTPTSKFNGRTDYEPMTAERGVTQDTTFANWGNSGQAPLVQQTQKPLTTAPRPAPNVTALGTQSSPRSPAGPRAQGVVQGYVYWDASVIRHSPPNSCSGLSMTASGEGIPLVTMTDNFAYMRSVGTDAVCKYAIKGLPVDQALQVQANVTSSAAFSPTVLASGGSQTVTLTTGAPACAPGPVNPSLSDLSSGWSSCADIASNVNFKLVSAGFLRSPVAGPARVAPGTAVELSPQPYPPKSRVNSAGQANEAELNPQPYPPKNGTLLAPGSQKTLLGDGSVQPAPGVGTVGPSQTMSAQGNVGAPTGQQGAVATLAPAMTANAANSRVLQRPIGIQQNPNIVVANACAKDSSYRVLFISGIPDGKTLTLNQPYTIWGCSFGNPPLVKQPTSPVTSPSQGQTEVQQTHHAAAIYITPAPSHVAMFIYAEIQSWSDNSIVVTFPTSAEQFHDVSLSSLVFPTVAQLWVTRGDQQTTIYPPENGGPLMFKPAN